MIEKLSVKDLLDRGKDWVAARPAVSGVVEVRS